MSPVHETPRLQGVSVGEGSLTNFDHSNSLRSASLLGHAGRDSRGRDALGYYHERQDEKRNVGLGPEHDWSSHAAGQGR
jgi:hypothetical protein